MYIYIYIYIYIYVYIYICIYLSIYSCTAVQQNNCAVAHVTNPHQI